MDNPDQQLKGELLLIYAAVLVRQYLALEWSVMNPDGKFSFKLNVYIYQIKYIIGIFSS